MTRWKPKKKVPDEQHIFYENVDMNGTPISTVDMRRELGTDLYERPLGMRIRLELPRGYQTADGSPMPTIVAVSYGSMIGWLEELYVRVAYTTFVNVLKSLLQSQEVRMRVQTIVSNDWWGLEYDRFEQLGYNSNGQYTAFSIGEVVTDILSGVKRG